MRRLAFLALPLVLATPALAQDEADAVRGFLAAPAGGAAVAEAGGTVAASGDTVTVTDLRLAFALPAATAPDGGRLVLTAPRAEIVGLAREGAGWRAAAIRLPEATLAADGTTEPRVGRVEIVAPRWPAPTVATAAGGPAAALEPTFAFLRALSAERVTVAGADVELTAGPVESGRIATARLVAEPPAAGRPKLEVAAEGLDVGAVADALFADGGARRVAVASVSVAGLDSPAAPGEAASTLGGMRLEGLTLEPQSPPLAARLDDYDAVEKAEPAPVDPTATATPDPPPPAEAVDLSLAIWRAVALDLVAFTDFDTTSAETGERTRIGRIAVAEIGAGRDADVTVERVAVDLANDERFALERLEIVDLRLPDWRFMRQVALAGAEPPSVDVIVGSLPILHRIGLAGLTGATADGVTFRIDEAAAEMGGHIGTIPTTLTSTAKGEVTLPPTLAPEDPTSVALLDLLRRNGLERLRFEVRDHLSWADDRVTYDSRNAVEGLARYGLTFALSGVPRYVFEDPRRAMEIVAFLSLDRFEASVEDLGIVPLLREFAQSQGTGDVDAQIRDGLALAETQMAPQIGPEAAATVRAALEGFVAGGRTLTLSGTPDRPVPLTQVGVAAVAPRALLDLLKLRLTVTP